MVPFVKGAVFSFLMKHKINVRGSTEIELVGVDDALPMMLWCKSFIKAQGCTVEKNILYHCITLLQLYFAKDIAS